MKMGINLDSIAYLTLIGLSIRACSFTMVLEIVEKMVKQGLSLGTHLNSRFLLLKISVYYLKKRRELLNVQLQLLRAYFSCGNVEEALETFSLMKSEGVNVALGTYSVLVAGLESCGRVSVMFWGCFE